MNPLLPSAVEILWAFIALVSFAFALGALASILKSENDVNSKFLWILFVLLMPILGATAWFIQKHKEKETPATPQS